MRLKVALLVELGFTVGALVELLFAVRGGVHLYSLKEDCHKFNNLCIKVFHFKETLPTPHQKKEKKRKACLVVYSLFTLTSSVLVLLVKASSNIW